LRPDKSALVWMDQVLTVHATGKLDRIPLYQLLSASTSSLKRRASSLRRRFREAGVTAHSRTTQAVLGGGTTPSETLASHGIALDGGGQLLDLLRQGSPPVIGRVEEDAVVLDLRTVFPHEDRELAATVVAAYHQIQDNQAPGR